MSAFDESKHDRDTSGRFTEMAGSEQTDTLIAPNPVAAFDAGAFNAQRGRAARLFSAAQAAYHQANRDAAAAELRAHFPWATSARFGRRWDRNEDEIELISLAGPSRTLDLDDGDKMRIWVDASTEGETNAIRNASIWIGQIGSDVSAYLDDGGEDEDGYYVYAIDLTADRELRSAADVMAEHLDEDGRGDLFAKLSEQDGRMPSVVDTHQMVEEITDGFLRETSPDIADEAIATFGSAEAAAKAVAASDFWALEREEFATRNAISMAFTIRRGLRAVLDKEITR